MDLHASYGSWFVNINKPVIEPLGESINNTQLFRMMAEKMGWADMTRMEFDTSTMGWVKKHDNAFTQTDEEMIRDILCEEETNKNNGKTFNCLM